jgi:RNA polymerase sigma-70 factor (ECF subfamily)
LSNNKFDIIDFDNAFQQWGERLNAFYPQLLSFAKSLTHNIDDAKDIVGDVILKALENQHKFKEGNLEAWLITLVRNNFLNKQSRRDKKRTDSVEDFSRIKHADTFARADACFFGAEFSKVYDALPNAEKEIVDLLLEEELNNTEIGKKLKIGNKVHNSVRRIRAKFKLQMPGYNLPGQAEPDILE